MYYDQSLVARSFLLGTNNLNDHDLYIGAFNIRVGVIGARFDNIQIFNKALTIDEIAIIALVNKDVITD